MQFTTASETANPRAIPLDQLKRALVIKLRHHGDVLLASPVFTALKHAAPQCEIDALVYAETAPMLEGHPAIEKIYLVSRERRRLHTKWLQEWHLLSALRSRRYDLILHLTGSWRGAWLVRVLQPRFSAALMPTLSPPCWFWRCSFSHLAPLPPLGNRHVVETHLDALRILGLQPSSQSRRLVFAINPAVREDVIGRLKKEGCIEQQLIHIHPTSRWMFKSWKADEFAAVIDELQKEGYRVVLTAAPADREIAFAQAILQHCKTSPLDWCGKLSLKEVGALIASARLSLCVDSAPMHMAAAVGTPVVALFGPSNPHEWGPWCVPHRVIVSNHSCRPCRLDGCGGGKVSECLMSISSVQVLEAIRSLLRETA